MTSIDVKYTMVMGLLLSLVGYHSRPETMPLAFEEAVTPAASIASLTETQLRAREGAEAYLRIMGYSRQKLIEALSSETGLGFSRVDAIVAVDSLNVDWNYQAERTAFSYIKMMPFSCHGLIDQLSMNAGSGFTRHQAEYGAGKTQACRTDVNL